VYALYEIVALAAPFVATLLALAFMPIVAAKFWGKYEWVALPAISVVSIALSYAKLHDFAPVMRASIISDYLPFIIMVFALYVLSNGIHVKIKASSNGVSNMIFLGVGSVFSSLIGTTGATVLLLPSFLKMNDSRNHKTHLVIFFIFMMANIGGMLTPLGDAPILIGYLHGVGFEWIFARMLPIWFASAVMCLIPFYFIDKFFLNLEKRVDAPPINRDEKFSISVRGWGNITLLFLTVAVLFVEFQEVKIEGVAISPALIRNAIFMIFALSSLLARKQSKIDFAPFSDVAKTFLMIFITMAPVMSILNANSDAVQGLFMDMKDKTDITSAYFWLCSITSAFLDNAPSYLLFFNIAGGNANELMENYPNILIAISSGSVIMGAVTYIGNAPNLMVRSLAEKAGIKMPSFVGYMAWSSAVIIPVGIALTILIKWLY
jgi:Na+/H+ antiporter NhaD/arsenite permease-like protein